MRRPIVALLLVLLAGCGQHDLPPVGETDGVRTTGAEAGTDPVRVELRRLFADCEDRREVLQSDVDHAQARLRRISGAAAIAWFIGEMASGASGTRSPPGDPTSIECSQPGGPGAGSARCSTGTLVVVQGGSASPAVAEARSVELDANQQVRAIIRAMDQIDQLLFDHPDPDRWTETEEERYQQLHEVLLTLCR